MANHIENLTAALRLIAEGGKHQNRGKAPIKFQNNTDYDISVEDLVPPELLHRVKAIVVQPSENPQMSGEAIITLMTSVSQKSQKQLKFTAPWDSFMHNHPKLAWLNARWLDKENFGAVRVAFVTHEDWGRRNSG